MSKIFIQQLTYTEMIEVKGGDDIAALLTGEAVGFTLINLGLHFFLHGVPYCLGRTERKRNALEQQQHIREQRSHIKAAEKHSISSDQHAKTNYKILKLICNKLDIDISEFPNPQDAIQSILDTTTPKSMPTTSMGPNGLEITTVDIGGIGAATTFPAGTTTAHSATHGRQVEAV